MTRQNPDDQKMDLPQVTGTTEQSVDFRVLGAIYLDLSIRVLLIRISSNGTTIQNGPSKR